MWGSGDCYIPYAQLKITTLVKTQILLFLSVRYHSELCSLHMRNHFMCSFAWLNRFTYWTVFCKMCYAAKFTAWMLSLVIFCNEIWAHCGDLSSQTFCSYQHRSILLCLSITPAVIYLTSDDFSITMSDELPTFQKWLQSIEKLLQWVSNCINP